jgi:effector-binding domain-containing protein
VPCEGLDEAPPGTDLDTWPAGDVARTLHTGSYDTLPGAYHAVIEWAASHGFAITGDPWETYLDGPEVSQPRTEICFPVAAQ